jgi:hypothetical protein
MMMMMMIFEKENIVLEARRKNIKNWKISEEGTYINNYLYMDEIYFCEKSIYK